MTAVRDKLSNAPMIGGYRLDDKIGTGAMGTVYRAHDLKLGRDVALKVVNTEDADAEVRQRFLQEGVAAARVRHPNVVQVLDAGKAGPVAYLAMQLLEGETLAECLHRQGRLPVPYAVDLILPVCAALHVAHGAGVLHRDLKPANIFLADVGRGDPEPMLLDFGISKIDGALDTALTQNPRFLGTPLYIAPEQADGAPGSALTDQYSLALTLYECLLGVRPFARYKESLIQLLRHVAEGDITAPRELDPSLPLGLNDAVCRGLSKEPGERFASVRDFGAALLPYASEARRTLWQLSFIDTDRTMASASSQLNGAPTERRRDGVFDPTRPHSRPPDSAEASSVSRRDPARWSAAPTAPLPPEMSQELPEARAPSLTAGLGAHSEQPSDRPISEPWSAPGEAASSARAPQTPLSQRLNRSSSRPPPRPAHQSKLILALSLLIAAVALIGTVALILHEFSPRTPSGYAVRVEVQPPEATLELDGQPVGHGRLAARFPRDGALHRLVIRSPGYLPQTLVFRDDAPPPEVTLVPIDAAPDGADDAASREASSAAASQAQLSTGAVGDEASSEEAAAARPPVSGLASSAPSARPASPSSPSAAASDRARSDPSAADPSAADPSAADATEADSTKEGASASDEPGPASSSAPSPTRPSKERSIHTGNLDPWAR